VWRAEAVVGHLEVDTIVCPGDTHGGGGARAGVLEGVGQRLLDDPVDAEAHAGGQVEVAAGLEVDRQADRPAVLRELVEPARIRLRGPLRAGLVRAAQHAEQPAQLGQRLPPGVGDRAHRVLRHLGIGPDRVSGAVGLHDHHAHRVCDDVVQLTGDARALLAHRELRLLIAFDLQQLQPLFQLGVIRTASADELAQRPAETEHHGDEEDHRDGHGLADAEDRPQEGADGQPYRVHERRAAADAGDHGVERDGQREIGRPCRNAEVERSVCEELEEPTGECHVAAEQRMFAAEDHRADHQRTDEQVHPQRQATVFVEPAADVGHHEQPGDQGVPEHRVSTHPQAQPSHGHKIRFAGRPQASHHGLNRVYDSRLTRVPRSGWRSCVRRAATWRWMRRCG
jgi:hypothetical protein